MVGTENGAGRRSVVITDVEKARRLKRKRAQGYLPMVSFDVDELCAEVARLVLPLGAPRINVSFCETDTLACITKLQDGASIYIHVLLNEGTTPVQVCRYIIAHELFHIVVPPETIDGRQVYHTETFWSHEAQAIPERAQAWTWILVNFGSCIRRDERNERTIVKRSWKRFRGKSRCSWDFCAETSGKPMY